MVQNASTKLTEMMNQALAAELQAIIQYQWHHVMVKGMYSADLSDVFKKASIVEMRHAERISERLNYFAVVPTVKPGSIAIGGDASTMIRADIKAEEEAITLYKTIIRQAASEGDETTRLLFEEILSEEEDHHDTFTTLLG
jgi:bacterioferritin